MSHTIYSTVWKDEVCAVTHYYNEDTGEDIHYMPANIKHLAKCRPRIKTFKGWNCDTTQCTKVHTVWFMYDSYYIFSGKIYLN